MGLHMRQLSGTRGTLPWDPCTFFVLIVPYRVILLVHVVSLAMIRDVLVSALFRRYPEFHSHGFLVRH